MKASNLTSFVDMTRRVAVVTAATMALAFGAAATAQPGGGPGGPAGAGRHGPGGEPFGAQVIESLKAKLNLDTAQQQLFDQALAAAKAARAAALGDRQTLRDTVRAELARAEPDLAAVARSADAVEARNRALRNQVRDRWLQLYATLAVEQKAVVRDALAAAMERREATRGRMIERFRERLGG
jgi:Spy/CpxP family protein refolding chaperone